MLKRNSRKLLAIMITLCMVFAAGCQAVAGLDLNQVLKNMLKVTSAEGTYEFEFKLHLNEEEWKQLAEEGEADDEELQQLLATIRQFTNIKVVVDQYKMQDESHVSMSGSLALGDEATIGFDVKMSDTLAVINLDGAKQPFSFDLTGKHAAQLERHYYETELGWDYEEWFGPQAEVEEVDEAALVEVVQTMSNLITDYTIERLPNVERLSVTPVNEEINGVTTDLLTVKAEVKGMELWDWAKKLVNALANDRVGMEKLISELFDLYQEHESTFNQLFNQGSYVYGITGAIPYDEEWSDEEWYDEEWTEEEWADEEWSDEELIDVESVEEELIEEETTEELVEEVELTPEEMKKSAVDELMNLLQELSESMNELEKEEEDKKTLEQLLNDSLVMTFEYGVDAKLNVRKQSFALDYTIDPEFKEELGIFGIDGFSLTSSSELWNVNQEVKAEEPRTTLSTVSLESLMYKEGFEVAGLFEKDSLIDTLLREQLHITAQSYWNYVDYLDEDLKTAVYLNANKQAMIPARSIIEEFGGKVSYNKQSKSVFLLDRATNTTIEITAGSNIAIINGEPVEWSSPVEITNGNVYVPARAMAEALGAEITWYNWGGLEINREP